MPELGSAHYRLILNTKEFDSGLTRAEQRAMRATNNISRSFGKADAAVASIGPTAQKAAGQVEVASGQMAMAFSEEGAAATKAAGTSEVAATRTASAWKRAAVAMKTSTASMIASSAAAGKAMIASGKKMRSIGRGLTRSITLPAAIVSGIGVKLSIDFNQQMKLLQTSAGASAREVEFMTKAIKEFIKAGADETATQLARALFPIESVGFRGAKAMEVLKAATDGAKTGVADLEETTNALVGVLKTGIEGTDSAAEAMATLNAGLGQGNLRLEALNAALGTGLANAAKSAAIPLDEILAALDVMTQQGIPAQTGATKLAMAIATIQAPTVKATKALKGLGFARLELADVIREKGLPAAIALLQSRLLGITDPSERAAIVLDIFSRRAGKSMITLLNGSEDLIQTTKNIKKTTKDFPALVKAAEEEDVNKLARAWARLNLSLIELGKAITPIVIAVANAISKLVAAFEKLPRPVRIAMLTAIGLAAVLGPLLVTIGFMTIGLGGLATAVGGAGTAFVAARLSAGTFALALGKGGLVGAALVAGFAIGDLILRVDAIRDAMRGAGDAAAGLAERLGLIEGAPTIPVGLEDPVIQAKLRIAYAEALQVPDIGDARDKIVEALVGPGFTFRDAEIFSGRRGRLREFIPPGPRGVKTPTPTPTPTPTKKPPKLPTIESLMLLPIGIRTRITKAERTKTLKDDLKAAREEEAFYQNLLRNARIRGEKRLEVEEAITSVMLRIDQLIEQMPKSRAFLRMPRFRQRLAKVRRTETMRDNLKFWRDEKDFLRGLLKQKNLERGQREQILDELKRVNRKIEAVKKKEAEEQERHFRRLRELQAVMDLRGSFFSEFAGNIFGQSAGGLTLNVTGQRGGDKNLTVNQSNTFNEIPRNRNRFAREMGRAAAATMDSM